MFMPDRRQIWPLDQAEQRNGEFSEHRLRLRSGSQNGLSPKQMEWMMDPIVKKTVRSASLAQTRLIRRVTCIEKLVALLISRSRVAASDSEASDSEALVPDPRATPLWIKSNTAVIGLLVCLSWCECDFGDQFLDCHLLKRLEHHASQDLLIYR